MCGIAGLVARDRANGAAVQAMLDQLVHRGPDGEGAWTSKAGACVLGHRRLAIIDLSPGGAQPMLDPERGLAITYNGEIYNYVELRERLRAKGRVFRSGSDTEVLLAAYAEWGEGMLAELNGMFAFAIWDERTQRLFCARDRFGEKPFHFAWVDGVFAFASEVKALATLGGIDLGIDEGVLAAGLVRGSTFFDASERTLVRGVQQLFPGHALVLERGERGVREVRRWSYWNLDVDGRHGYGQDSLAREKDALLELLTDSVRLRLRSDVRVGSCLSGGLDSSTLVCLMRRLEPAIDLRTFTGRFPGDPLDEGKYARMVVDQCHTHHFETEPSAERFARDAARVYWHADFPIGGMSQFAQFCVFGLAKEHDVTVLLDGQGSDEQLGGYGNDITRSFLHQLAHERRARAFLREQRHAARSAPQLFSWSRLFVNETPARALMPAVRKVTGRSVARGSTFLQASVLEEAKLPPPPMDLAAADRSLSRTLWTLSFRTMLSGLLRFGDRLSMAHSREVRLPFCDHRVAERAFAMSPELLVGSGEVKRVLRAAIEGLVPAGIVRRPKQGFVPPQTSWLVGPLAGWFRELVDDPGPVRSLVDVEAARALARADESVRRRDVRVLWEQANVLAWSRYALAPMRALPKTAPALA